MGSATMPSSPPSVLVVDDESSVLRVLEVTLQRQGLRVYTARGGREALAVFEKHRDEIGVVLLDVQMRGMDGPQTLAALRELDPEVRCCFMSGYAAGHSVEELRTMAVAFVFEKPF